MCGLQGDASTDQMHTCSCSGNETERHAANSAYEAAAGGAFGTLIPPRVGRAVQAAVVRSLARPASACVPAGVVMLTIVNMHHLPFYHQQFARVPTPTRVCLARRLVALCLGHNESAPPGGHNESTAAAATCVVAPPTSASDHRRGHFHQIAYVRYRLLRLALICPGAVAAFFTDADVAYFGSPFRVPDERGKSALLRADDLARVDLIFVQNGRAAPAGRPLATAAASLAPQTHPWTHPSWCAGGIDEWNVNSGQMLVTSLELVEAVIAAEPRTVKHAMPLDQQHLQAVVRRGNWRTCTWPPAVFGDHCVTVARLQQAASTRAGAPAAAALGGAYYCPMHSYHATCRSAFASKMEALQDAIRGRDEAGCAEASTAHPTPLRHKPSRARAESAT